MASEKNNFSRVLRRNGIALLTGAGLFALVFYVTFSLRGGNSDFWPHLVWATLLEPAEMLSRLFDGSERLWHILVKLCCQYLFSNAWAAAAFVTAAADTAAYFLVYKTWDRALPDRVPRWLLALLCAAVFVVSSVTLPGQYFYRGRSAVNTWHNPTNIMVRPFAAAVFFMTINIYNRRRYGQHTVLVAPPEDGRLFRFEGGFWAQFRQPVYTRWELVLYPICLFFSVDAKPSFLQFFAPAIFLFLLIDVIRTKGMLLPFSIKLAAGYLPAVAILFMQFLGYFGGNLLSGSDLTAAAEAASTDLIAATESAGSGISIYFLQPSFPSVRAFFDALAGQLPYILCPSAFPLLVLLAAPRRNLRDGCLRLAWLCVLAATLESFLLHETGARASHGNFGWAQYLAMWILWTASLGRFVTLAREKSLSGTVALYGGSALLLWHMVCGVGYILNVIESRNFYL